MTDRKRRTWGGTAIACLGAAALGGVMLLAVQGCAPAVPANAATADHHTLTIPEAEAAYHAYLTASDTAAAQGDRTQGLSIVADAQWAVVHGQYTALQSQGVPVPRYRYGTPTFYVPALTNYPQWFMVAATRTAYPGGDQGSTGAGARTLMVFERAEPGATWTLDGTAVLDQALPAIARDRDGYAVDVSTTDSQLLLPPDVVGPTQAAVVDDGPASAAAAVIGDGPQTTGLYAAQAAQANSDAAHGWQYQWLLQGAAFPQFEMETANGGALVLYGMYLNTTTQHANLAAGAPIPVPAAVSPLLAAPTEVGYHAVYANWTYQYAAIDPPATAKGAKVQVIASGGGLSYGHAY